MEAMMIWTAIYIGIGIWIICDIDRGLRHWSKMRAQYRADAAAMDRELRRQNEIIRAEINRKNGAN